MHATVISAGILKQSFGGNAFTSVLLTVNACSIHKEVTLDTLKFGAMCKKITNMASVNEVHETSISFLLM
jgi:hypothetical protein